MKVWSAIFVLALLCGPAIAAEAQPSSDTGALDFLNLLTEESDRRDKLAAMMDAVRASDKLLDAAMKDIDAQVKTAAPQIAKLRKAGKTEEAMAIFKKIDADCDAKVAPILKKGSDLFDTFADFYMKDPSTSRAKVQAFLKEQDKFHAAFRKRLDRVLALEH